MPANDDVLASRLSACLSPLEGLRPSTELCDVIRALRRARLGVLEKEKALVTLFEVFLMAREARLKVLSMSFVVTSKASGSAV